MLEPVAIGKAHQTAFIFNHWVRQAVGQHTGSAARHIGLGGGNDLEGSCARVNMVMVKGGGGDDVFVAAGSKQRQGKAPVVQ